MTTMSTPGSQEHFTFIVGTGRCGSTALYEILSYHPEISWLSNVLNVFPHRPALNRPVVRMPQPFQRMVHGRVRPAECYPFWETHATGFSEPCRDLRPDDLSVADARALREALGAAMGSDRKPVIKLTGWPRMRYLDALYPDAMFIHLERDARAVVNSLLHVDFWSGWKGPDNWRWGPLSTKHRDLWERHDRSFVVLAAIELKVLSDAFDASKEAVGSHRVLELSYEELCSRPEGSVARCVEFIGVGEERAVERAMARQPFRSSNDRWTRDLNEEQQRALFDSLDELGLLPS